MMRRGSFLEPKGKEVDFQEVDFQEVDFQAVSTSLRSSDLCLGLDLLSGLAALDIK
jgi:hypothetical protein